MKFKSDVAQRFYDEMYGFLYGSFAELDAMMPEAGSFESAHKRVDVEMEVVAKKVELMQAMIGEAAEIEINDIASQNAIKVGMASVYADHTDR